MRREIVARQHDLLLGVPVNLGPQLNTGLIELPPALSGDGRCLIYSSNGLGGVGGTDLFESRRTSRDAPFGPPARLRLLVSRQKRDTGGWLKT